MPKRVLIATVTAVLTLGLAACEDRASDDVVSTDEGVTTTAGPVEDDAAAVCEFGGGIDDVRVDPEGFVFIAEVVHEVKEPRCVERVVFEFEEPEPGAAVGHIVGYREAPFTDPSGATVEVAGTAFLAVILLHGTTVDLTGPDLRITFDGPVALDPDGSFVVEIAKVSDFEATSEWVVGLDTVRPFTVTSDARSLVVDIGPADEESP